jgi:hypothetical protein
MSLAQRIAKAWVSKEKFAAFEAETRKWVVECCTCGRRRDLWDLGGIKYKAYGTSYTYGKCPACQKRRPHKLYDKTKVQKAK